MSEQQMEFTRGDPMTSKLTKRLLDVGAQADEAYHVAGQQVMSILADTERALKRAAKRASVPEDFERIEIVQQDGPTIEFSGRLLAENEFTTNSADPMRVSFEIFETPGGSLIGVVESSPANREGLTLSRVCVAEPQDDAQAMRLAIMDHFQWHDRARTMARKLGWSLKVEVE